MAKMKSPLSLMKEAKALTSSDKRDSIRFEPDPGTLALIDPIDEGKKRSFQPKHAALVTEESHRGCGLVLRMCKELQIGSLCRVKVGHASPLIGQIRWRVELDSQVIRIGIMYLD
jgi:hypothetical protein